MGQWRVGVSHKYWSSSIRAFHYTRIEWNLSQECKFVFLAHSFCALFSKDIVLGSTIRTNEITHVFNHSHNRYVQFLEHSKCLDCNVACNFLWSCNNNYTSNWNGLCKCQRNVTCSRWKVHNKIIKIRPVGINKK